MSADLVYAIHGFLGQSSDWDSIKKKLPQINLIAEDLFSEKEPIGIEVIHKFPGKKIFLGYSLGGRLGLQILKKTPELFDHYIFLSTNPGLQASDLDGRRNRIINDEKWSEKITEKNWADFLKEWNAQCVFQGSSSEPVRDINQYDLQKLRQGIVNWSLGFQEDFSDIIQKNNSKITWVVGDRDFKYCEIAEQMKNKKILSGFKKISAGHRIWLDNPSAVVEIINRINL